MKEGTIVLKQDGNKKVKITDDGYGLEMYTMRNGFQWTGFGVDDQLLSMIRESISEYFSGRDSTS